MPKIEISESTLSQLKKLGKAFSPAEVIEKLIVHYHATKKATQNISTDVKSGDETYEPDDIDVSSTKILSVSINEKEMNIEKNWGAILREMIKILLPQYGKEEIIQKIGHRLTEGRHTYNGNVPIEDINFSLQGQPANEALDNIRFLSIKYNCPVTISFQWRNNKNAAHPGETGTIEIP